MSAYRFLAILIALCIFCLAMVVWLKTAGAEDLPRGLGHTTGIDHFYDASCCDLRDCEPVEAGAIVPEPGGFRIHYLTSAGREANGFLTFGSSGIRISKDGREHACAVGALAVCVYIPAGT